jgi:RHS repeat-associated protein
MHEDLRLNAKIVFFDQLRLQAGVSRKLLDDLLSFLWRQRIAQRQRLRIIRGAPLFDLLDGCVKVGGKLRGNAVKYDAESRMTPVSGATYTYDGDGRRVQKSDGTLYWVDDSFEPLSVGTTSGITQDYVFLDGKRIAFVPLSSGNPYYYLSDHLSSDTVVASGDGKTIQWEADYFPFGALRTVITNLTNNPYQFTGYEYDSGTGYNYAVARFQAGRWGRFLSADPYLGSADITNPQSLNRYSYVLNQVTRFFDPLGLDQVPFTCVNNVCHQDGPLVQTSDVSGMDPSGGGSSGGSSQRHGPLQDGGDGGGGGAKKGPAPGEDKSTTCRVTNTAAAAFAINAATFGVAGGVLSLSGVGAPVGVILIMGGGVAAVLSGAFWLGGAIAGC